MITRPKNSKVRIRSSLNTRAKNRKVRESSVWTRAGKYMLIHYPKMGMRTKFTVDAPKVCWRGCGAAFFMVYDKPGTRFAWNRMVQGLNR